MPPPSSGRRRRAQPSHHQGVFETPVHSVQRRLAQDETSPTKAPRGASNTSVLTSKPLSRKAAVQAETHSMCISVSVIDFIQLIDHQWADSLQSLGFNNSFGVRGVKQEPLDKGKGKAMEMPREPSPPLIPTQRSEEDFMFLNSGLTQPAFINPERNDFRGDVPASQTDAIDILEGDEYGRPLSWTSEVGDFSDFSTLSNSHAFDSYTNSYSVTAHPPHLA